MEDLELIYIYKGGPYGDCMAAYEVQFNRQCSLGEFVDAILKRKEEWGGIMIGSTTDIRPLPKLKYRRGEIVSSEFSEKDLRMPIKSVEASYGWTCGDYWVEIINETSNP